VEKLWEKWGGELGVWDCGVYIFPTPSFLPFSKSQISIGQDNPSKLI
tara:strand:+ start:899 stop:1039 length:141 start_codon:yes stop_codon:yes gene_type:complete